MTRNAALVRARKNYRAHNAAVIAHLFNGAAKPCDSAFGHRNGWFMVSGFNFSTDELTGVAYDLTQGGWAYL